MLALLTLTLGAWEGVKAQTTLAGNGTSENPYLIGSADDWNAMATLIGGDDNSSYYYKQTADFTVPQAIGSEARPFRGHYDGDGKKLNVDMESEGTTFLAPFSHVGGESSFLRVHTTGSVWGGIHSSGLVGKLADDARCTIKDCLIQAIVVCGWNTGSEDPKYYGGGLVGHAGTAEVNVEGCVFNSSIMPSIANKETIAGAIIGWATGDGSRITVKNCVDMSVYPSPQQTPALIWCYNNGTRQTKSGDNCYTVALYTANLQGAEPAYSVTSGTEQLTLNYDITGHESEKYATAGITFYMNQSNGTNAYTSFDIEGQRYYKQGSTTTFLVTVADNYDYNKILSNGNELTATTDGQYTATVDKDLVITTDATKQNWIDHPAAAFSVYDENSKTLSITSADELARLLYLVNVDHQPFSEWTITLTTDLDMDKYLWTAIGFHDCSFKGTFLGEGHTISGMHNENDKTLYAGLFGICEGTVKGVNIANSTLKGKYAGGVVGMNIGIITECTVAADVTLTPTQEWSYIGGVTGEATSGKITGCVSAATVSGMLAGGLVGDLYSGSEVQYCVYTGTSVTSTSEYGSRAAVVAKNNGGKSWYNYYTNAALDGANSNDTRAYAIYNETLFSPSYSANYHTFTYSDMRFSLNADVFTIGTTAYAKPNTGVLFSVTVPVDQRFEPSSIYYTDQNNENHTLSLSTTNMYNIDMPAGEITLKADFNVRLFDDAENSAFIKDNIGKTYNVKLKGRTLYRNDGAWNTVCLPFNVVLEGSIFEGADIQQLDNAEFADGTLTLNFKALSGTELWAGIPYIVKWKNGEENVTDPIFTNIRFGNSTPEPRPEEVINVTFQGTYDPVTLTGGDKSVLYLGADNTLYYPSEAMNIGTCRAYFKLNGITAGDIQQQAIVLNYGDGETTRIIPIDNGKLIIDNDGWYTLDGVRLNAQPIQKGLYIHNGRKVVMK